MRTLRPGQRLTALRSPERLVDVVVSESGAPASVEITDHTLTSLKLNRREARAVAAALLRFSTTKVLGNGKVRIDKGKKY